MEDFRSWLNKPRYRAVTVEHPSVASEAQPSSSTDDTSAVPERGAISRRDPSDLVTSSDADEASRPPNAVEKGETTTAPEKSGPPSRRSDRTKRRAAIRRSQRQYQRRCEEYRLQQLQLQQEKLQKQLEEQRRQQQQQMQQQQHQKQKD